MTGFDRAVEIEVGQAAKGRGRGCASPVRRLQTLNAASLLIDEDRRVWPIDRRAKFGDETANLLGRFAISFEKNEAPRFRLGKEVPLRRRQSWTGATENHGAELGFNPIRHVF